MKRKLLAAATRTGVAIGAVMLVAVAVNGFFGAGAKDGQDQAALKALGSAEQSHQGWSSEVLASIHHGILEHAPIRVANACGIGATSCFKCHNKGRRGPAPAMDAKTDPWHPDHSEVNHDCDGCHQGNPRLMVKGIAHRDMFADPRKHPQKACASCHAGAKVSKLLSKYKNVGQ
ncbi:MAG TPA: hypothetical protein VKA48_11390 [Gammaproteobacteria bacterium]|nr:hypothetical protein [Gammaproteobacteria bacterium]